MAKSFDSLVKRTTSKKTRAKAASRAQELLGKRKRKNGKPLDSKRPGLPKR